MAHDRMTYCIIDSSTFDKLATASKERAFGIVNESDGTETRSLDGNDIFLHWVTAKGDPAPAFAALNPRYLTHPQAVAWVKANTLGPPTEDAI